MYTRLRAVGITLGHPGMPLGEMLDLAIEAERAGLGLVCAGEGPVDTFTLLGALAARTERVELYSSVANWSRTPVTTALSATTLQELSCGRFRLGLGATPRAWSEGWHDVAYERPVERMRDFVGAIRAAWCSRPGSPIDHTGPFYRIRGYERPGEPPAWPVPVYLAATRPRMTELAGELADGVVLNLMHSSDWLRSRALPGLASGLARAGRARSELDVGILAVAAIADDRAEAFELVRPGIAFYFLVPYFRELLDHHGFEDERDRGYAAAARGDRGGMLAAVSDELVSTMALVGTEADIRRQLEQYEGLVDWVEVMAPIGLPGDVTRIQTERIVSALSRYAVR